MSGKGIALEEFGTGRRAARSAGDTVLAEARLEAFDKGYREGWEDAAAAYAAEQAAIGADLARALDDMSFTYHEARRAMLVEMRALMGGILEKVLPGTMRAALGQTILERIGAAVAARGEIAVEITVAPENRPRVAPLLQGGASLPVRLAEEPSLGPGQAVLRFGPAEELVDLDAVAAGIAAAVDGFFTAEAADGKEER